MIQYLINCSAIWLLFLISFDLLLSNSKLHQYNRFYLLGALLLGLFVPLISLENAKEISPAATHIPIILQTLEMKKNMVDSVQIENSKQSILNWRNIIFLVYFSGLIVSLSMLLWDISKSMLLFKKGTKLCIDGMNIVETGKGHGPFSFFGKIFIGDCKNYTASELDMILRHENTHINQFHSIDLLFISLVRIVFWFHPLPYFYTRRLLLVHEYLADEKVEQPLSEYGTLLLEQSILQSSPNFSHSFINSPLKKRLVMLTQKKTKRSKGKMLIVLPILALSVFMFSKTALSDNKKIKDGNKLTYKGNVFEMTSQEVEFEVPNSETGLKEKIVAQIDPFPVKINDQKIYSDEEVQIAPKTDKDIFSNLKDVFEEHKGLFDKLEDGTFRIRIGAIVVDEQGKVVYSNFQGIDNQQSVQDPLTKIWSQKPLTSEEALEAKKQIDKLIEEKILSLQFEPATLNGKNVICRSNYANIGFGTAITVKDNNALFEGNKGLRVQRILNK